MSYTPPTFVQGDTLDEAAANSLITSHRDELNNQQLTSLGAGLVTSYHVEKPTYKPTGFRSYEQRGVSGGIKYMSKKSASLAPIVDATWFEVAGVSAPSAGGNVRGSESIGASMPENSLLTMALHRVGGVAQQGQPELSAPVPGFTLSVLIDKPAHVVFDAKFIMNFLPTNVTLGGLHQENTTTVFPFIAIFRKPDGTFSQFTTATGHVTGETQGHRCQSNWDFREQYVNCLLDVDGTTNPVGEYSFFIAADLPLSDGYQTQDYNGKTDCKVATIGASTLSIEWFYK